MGKMKQKRKEKKKFPAFLLSCGLLGKEEDFGTMWFDDSKGINELAD